MKHQDYLPCVRYQNQPLHHKFEGFSAFLDQETQQYYFALVDASGALLLIGEGYPEEKSLTTGIKAVQKNLKDPKRYKFLEAEGSHFLSLKAGNHREIARSCPFATLQDAEGLRDLLLGNQPESPSNNADFYFGQERIWDDAYGRTGYSTFTHNQKYYFVVYNEDDSVYLRSDGFANVGERDAAFEELKHHIVREDAYRVVESKEGFFAALYDYEGREIARSLPYASFFTAFITTPSGRQTEITDALF